MASSSVTELRLERLEREDTVAERSGSGEVANVELSRRRQISHLVDSACDVDGVGLTVVDFVIVLIRRRRGALAVGGKEERSFSQMRRCRWTTRKER
ncbi:hypothetical protein BHM03_00033839 [Ensete ventricosum]|nr:hypothetical protein BHM03_00033839 [Ensete ventricosum]